ncbi:MAG: pantothenate synthase [Heterodermia speciosa]|uniref:Pantoate--beta-alanine ligase n=1 Tax=Heterodermia speciosa TaxID=116794 RepID=A0A8H3J2V2_9LECA|nr:MAG: pantothenate synthase [Heterodermia speciosa]
MPLPLITTIPSMRTLRSTLPAPVALVPTMGMLHPGHLSLIRLAASSSRSIIISIYVNPTQLSPAARRSYPATLEADVALLESLDAELERDGEEGGRMGAGRIEAVFAPEDEEMYPCLERTEPLLTKEADAAAVTDATDVVATDDDAGWSSKGSFVNVAPLADGRLEGINQPYHFIGVATVCLKLFNAVKPHRAIFGAKDYQQTVIVKTMVRDLLLDLEILVGETVRDADGLAVSSRNVYLGRRRRRVAPVLWRALCAARDAYRDGEGRRARLLERAAQEVSEERKRQWALETRDRVEFDVLYFEVSDLHSLESVERVDTSKGALLSGAIQMLPLEDIDTAEDAGRLNGRDSVRIIDSIVL